MKGLLLSGLFILISWTVSAKTNASFLSNTGDQAQYEQLAQTHDEGQVADGESSRKDHAAEGEDHGHEPAPWAVIPFVLLLAMIATGPLFYPHFWHRYYPIIAFILGSIVVFYYLLFLGDHHHPLHAFGEYFSFITLVAALFIASGGILIKVDKAGTPMVNVALLIFGSIIANIIGTTGASMLLIRPFIRVNKTRIKPYHIVFFIFMVSNMGGVLTPIGDPPLFLGFLKGVPFFWTVEHLWTYWIVGIGLMALIFFFMDRSNHAGHVEPGEENATYSGKIIIKGAHSLLWLLVIIIAVFIDPNVFSWVPALNVDGVKISFVRELIMIGASIGAFKSANKDALRGNEFDFEPIKEVAYLFVGIFATMMPALQLIADFAKSPTGMKLVNAKSLYWATGMLSGVLDNAPTYLNFLAAGMGKAGYSIDYAAQVLAFSNSNKEMLAAISVGAVFFGAFTYIGNAPNFMVKSIAEQVGVKMPSFMGYVIRYSIPILLPVLFIVWFIYDFLGLFNIMFG